MNRNLFLSLVIGLSVVFYTFQCTGAELVKFPAGDAAWTVDITYATASGGPSSATVPSGTPSAGGERPKKIEVTQSGGMQKVRIIRTDGKVLERWGIPSLSITLESDPRNDSVFPVKSGSDDEKFTKAALAYDASAFAWLKATDQIGTDPSNYLGKKCFHYEGTTPSLFVARNVKPVPLKRTAWIESVTLLPAALITDVSVSVFTFQPPPKEPLVLPPKFQAELDYYKRMMGIP